MKIGVLGGGQLGQMMALAGYPLGLRLRFLDKDADTPAGRVAECMVADFNDPQGLERFGEGLELVTYEFENVPAAAARFLAQRVPEFFPPPQALEIAQDRFVQKQFFQRLGIPAPAFRAVNDREDLDLAVESTGLPAVLKTRCWGYDGKGQRVLGAASELDAAWQSMGGCPLIAEAFVHFEREVSLIAVRSAREETAFYAITENRHREGILRVSVAPSPGIGSGIQELAQDYANKIFRELRYVGVLTLEFFLADGKLLINEMATRVHNSGHWTIEGAETSQFENHLRAITGLPLGSTAARGAAAMVNFIGRMPRAGLVLAIPGAHLHVYGKTPRPGRKLGHATLCAPQLEALASALERLRELAGCRESNPARQ
ncbi:MAG: 5-(carboxyamino)imidazole ribonucleotide synthase [Terriglobia bacterium]